MGHRERVLLGLCLKSLRKTVHLLRVKTRVSGFPRGGWLELVGAADTGPRVLSSVTTSAGWKPQKAQANKVAVRPLLTRGPLLQQVRERDGTCVEMDAFEDRQVFWQEGQILKWGFWS